MPAEFTRADVERIARLARIELTEHEKTLLTPQLSDFLAYAEQVQQVATSGVPPTSHPLIFEGGVEGSGTTWRSDDPLPSLPRAEALAQAPEADIANGLFKVPRVLG
jgi:aspartyl-tRNA(Asn)/glutamyl-tRNA(Gln) amidotransferase subunit C